MRVESLVELSRVNHSLNVLRVSIGWNGEGKDQRRAIFRMRVIIMVLNGVWLIHWSGLRHLNRLCGDLLSVVLGVHDLRLSHGGVRELNLFLRYLL